MKINSKKKMTQPIAPPIPFIPPGIPARKKKCPPLLVVNPNITQVPEIQPTASSGIAYCIGNLPEATIQRVDLACKKSLLETNGIGKNGSYLAYSEEKDTLVVVKPEENERGTPLNQISQKGNGRLGGASKDGILPGESAFTEYLVYKYLDPILESLTCKYPNIHLRLAKTGYGKLASPAFHRDLNREGPQFPIVKHASVHEFISNCRHFDPIRDISLFNKETAICLAIADMRLFNADRNQGNLLIHDSQLIPIDHGLCLSRRGESNAVFSWLDVCAPFLNVSPDPLVLDFMKEFDLISLRNVFEKIQYELQTKTGSNSPRDRFFSPERLWTYLVVGEILNQGIAQNLSLYEIATLLEGATISETGVKIHTEEPRNAIFQLSLILRKTNFDRLDLSTVEQTAVHAYIQQFKENLEQLSPQEQRYLMNPREIGAICIKARENIRLHQLSWHF